jgi:hypothetical protein
MIGLPPTVALTTDFCRAATSGKRPDSSFQAVSALIVEA